MSIHTSTFTHTYMYTHDYKYMNTFLMQQVQMCRIKASTVHVFSESSQNQERMSCRLRWLMRSCLNQYLELILSN